LRSHSSLAAVAAAAAVVGPVRPLVVGVRRRPLAVGVRRRPLVEVPTFQVVAMMLAIRLMKEAEVA
jgi:hypothetical protein